MNDDRLSTEDFSAALSRLREGSAEDPAKTSLVIDGVIQRFEFTFEQSWKAMQTALRRQGFDCRSPRGCIKQAFQAGIIRDGNAWILMLEDRNKTSHLYDAREALAIFLKIRDKYVALFGELERALAEQAD
jgi:nucleotidyltransferase substrate binding protein (TIGR01987 family)